MGWSIALLQSYNDIDIAISNPTTHPNNESASITITITIISICSICLLGYWWMQWFGIIHILIDEFICI